MDKVRKALAILLSAAAAAAAAVYAPSIAMTGGDLAVLMTSFTGGGGYMSGGDYTHLYTLGAASTIMSGGSYTLAPGPLNTVREARLDNEEAHCFPNPYKPHEGHTRITFTKLTYNAEINIYTLSGQRVRRLEKFDPTDTLVWPSVTNDRGEPLASGVYLFVVSEKNLKPKRGKLMIVK